MIKSSKKQLLLVIFVLVILEIIIFYLLKKYNITHKAMYMVFALFAYIILAFSLSYCFNFAEMAIINGIWNGISMLTIAIMGWLLFGEKLTMEKIIALILISIAIILAIK